MIIVYIILGLIVIIGLWIWAVYNGLITLKNRPDEAWSDIDVQTKRRYDLIPNLVESVKGYATHEREAFENVTRARAAAMGAQSPEAKGVAENVLSGALKSLFAVAEAYPDLKASQNFMKLQEELSDTENKIQAARRFYNGNVRDLNIKIEQFPTNVFARQLGFNRREFFAVENEAEKQPVQVKF
jgi:LemA protein